MVRALIVQDDPVRTVNGNDGAILTEHPQRHPVEGDQASASSLASSAMLADLERMG